MPPIGIVAGALLLVAIASRRKPKHQQRAVTESPKGISVSGKKIVVTSWSKWMAWAPGTIEMILADGSRRAEPVTAALMQRSIPQHRWPPLPNDPGFEQWPELVELIAMMFNLDPEPERFELRVVK